MGSSASKSIDHESTMTPVGHRSCSRNVFQNSCIRPASGSSDNSDTDDDDDDDEQVSDHQPKENNILNNHSTMSSSKSKGKLNRNKDIKMKRADKRSYIPSETHFGEWGESSLSGSSHNPSSSFLSHFSFFSGNQSSRSSRAYLESSTSSIMSNDSNNKTKIRHGCEIFPSCFKPTSSEPQDSDSDSSDVSSIYESGQTGNNNNEMELNHRVFSPRNGSGYGGNRRVEGFEPIEQNIRFSRTLSVGRLRDRVLNRPIELASEREMIMSNENMTSSSNMSNSFYTNHILEVERMSAREMSYPNLLEHRANFLERRRRIRSQVHALQRMGNRFENLSGHERSCVLSGQLQTGHCTCRVNNQDSNNARGSISRIVLLAEALSEVLDEIHQQSVVSSSRYALSSTGSVPAPIEVVESLPVKLYCKKSKHLKEEDAQCYICLVEYEDGDEVRVLPCHHEFHRLCIDKWLKEIHRICPLCRGDICKTA